MTPNHTGVPGKEVLACTAYDLQAEPDLAAIVQIRSATGICVKECLSCSLDMGPAGD